MSIIGRKFLIIDKSGNVAVHFCKIIDNKINTATVKEKEIIMNLYFNQYKKEANE